MKIGLFTDTYYPQINGVANSVLTLKNNLEKAGHVVYVFTTTEPKAPSDEKNVYRMPSVQVTNDNRMGLFSYPGTTKFIWGLDLDIIHTHTEFSLGGLGHNIARYFGLPHIHTMHTIYEDFTHFLINAEAFDIITKPAARLLTRRFCNSADKIIAPTDKTNDLLKSYGVEKPITVISTGIELQMFHARDDNIDNRQMLCEQYGIAKSDKVLLYIGRISKEKNIDELLKMLAGFLPERPEVKFLLVGDGADRDALKRLSYTLGIAKQVIFAGEKPWHEIGSYYNLGDIFISASQSETQGLTYIEALASGIPIVGKHDRCLDDVLIEGDNGFSYIDKSSLYNALDELLSNDLLRNTMGVIAAKSAQKFTATHYANAVASLYSEITATWPYRKQYSIFGKR